MSDNGRTVAIGAKHNDGNGIASGHVRVYTWSSTINNWIQLGSDMDGESQSDNSGYSVSMSGNGQIVAIGARNNDGNGWSSGHVRVYT
mmetsp:Transcript_16564/g.19188  ORF Transcript_16564/g.19188 Transcript_16564/m.19188 type:complete len:88 (+) Transcript_16564:533-796(+)